MAGNEQRQAAVAPSDKELVLSSLERDQLAGSKKQHIPRRSLTPGETFVLWFLRVYLLFMVSVVVYQVLRGAR